MAAYGSPTRTRTWIDRLTAGCPTVGRSGSDNLVDHRGNAPRRACLQGMPAPLCVAQMWCPVVVSSHALLLFRQTLSPDQLTRLVGVKDGRGRPFVSGKTGVDALLCWCGRR